MSRIPGRPWRVKVVTERHCGEIWLVEAAVNVVAETPGMTSELGTAVEAWEK